MYIVSFATLIVLTSIHVSNATPYKVDIQDGSRLIAILTLWQDNELIDT